MLVSEPIRNHPEIAVNSMLNGSFHDTKGRIITFDATQPHRAEPFTGTRYSITFYSVSRWKEMSDEAQIKLWDLGFLLPDARLTNRNDERHSPTICLYSRVHFNDKPEIVDYKIDHDVSI